MKYLMYRDWSGFELFFIEILKCASLPALQQIAHRFETFLMTLLPRGPEALAAAGRTGPRGRHRPDRGEARGALRPGARSPRLSATLRTATMAAEKNPFAKFLNHFTKGTVLFHEGDEGEEMYIIQSGKVAIKKKVKDGETTLAVLEKGDFFGEMAILERCRARPRAEVVEDGDLIVISSEIFGDMIKANPEIAVRMLRKYSHPAARDEPSSSRSVAARAERGAGRARERRPGAAAEADGTAAGRGDRATSSPSRAATCSRCSRTTR